MNDTTQKLLGETLVRFDGMPFYSSPDKVIYYDPKGTSDFSLYIERHLNEIKDWFQSQSFEFYYIPDLCNQIRG